MELKNLKTKILAQNMMYYLQIDSTQDEIWRLVKNKTIKNGTLVLAEIQTAGKGTHGRIWHTDETDNIAFSFFLKLNCKIEQLSGITIKIAEIIVEIFKEKYKINLEIKEPNDIMFKNKKVGGILTQTKVKGEYAKCIVVGIGINTNKTNFTEDIKNIATSIKKEFNIKIDSKEFIAEFCNKFEKEIYNENRFFISRSRLSECRNGKRYI